MAEPYLKLYRKLLKWEWYDDINTCRLFLHCLLRAEWQPGSWHGIKYEAGQFITSLPNLVKETGLTLQQVRTALEHLKSTGEVTDFRQGNARIITVIKWSEYQADNRLSNRLVTDLQQTCNRPLTACKEYKEYKEIEEGEEDTAPQGDIENIVDHWNKFFKPVSVLSQTRVKALVELLENFTVEEVKAGIDKAKESNYLQNSYYFSFDWLIKLDNFVKVADGNYDDKTERDMWDV